MFKNRSIQVKLTKDDAKTPNELVQIDRDDVLFWSSVFQTNLERIGGGLIVLYAAKKAIDTASQVIIKMTPVA